MANPVDLYSVSGENPGPSFAPGEIAMMCCDRCGNENLPWELRTFGKQAICGVCYGATLELARAAIRAMPADEPNRQCSNCRALRQPALGSAWCAAAELGDDRARICANFVSNRLENARESLNNGRQKVMDVWASVTHELRATLGEGSFNTWFQAIEPLEIDGEDLVLAVQDEYTRDWLQQRLHDVVRNAIIVAGYPHLVPRYTVEAVTPRTGTESKREISKIAYNRHYTFAEFIVGSGNRLAHASALAVVDNPGRVYNPLVLYGGVGVGKTHLLQAIGQEAIDSGKIALYVTSETFTNELILAIRDASTNAFRDRYRNVDYLLIDDVQFIAGKEATQEEFFHTFNALHQAGKQIVLTSDRPPSALKGLQDRLVSRFAWGMMADMQPPDLETRLAILRSKGGSRRARLPETVLNAVALRIATNVRELEGTLNRVIAQADLLGTEPTIDVVRAVLGETGLHGGSTRPDDILQAVATYYRVKGSELAGPQRERAISYARQIAMYLLREEAKLSLLEIGNQLGGRNHSTVIYGCDKIDKEARHKGHVRQDLQAIKQLLYGVR